MTPFQRERAMQKKKKEVKCVIKRMRYVGFQRSVRVEEKEWMSKRTDSNSMQVGFINMLTGVIPAVDFAILEHILYDL